jgi:flagellar hook-associated protein 3 FlgL
MRIPNLTISHALVNRLNSLNVQQNQYNDELSSGQRITNPSEDPQAANRIIRLRSEKSAVQVYAKNGDRALSVSQATYAALDQIKSLSDRAGELATLSNSDNVSAAERKAYAIEVNQLIKQAIDAGNTKYQGEFLFNGTNTTTIPFVDDGTATPASLVTKPAAPVTLSGATVTSGSTTVAVASTTGLSVGMAVVGSGIPAGATVASITDANTFELNINATSTGAVNLNAASNGLSIQLSDSVSISPFTSGAGNSKIATFITNLISLRDGLNNTAAATDNGSAVITTARQALLSSEDDLVGVIADNSALQTRIESVRAQSEARFANMQSLISKDADVDVSQTMVDLTRVRTAYQAALQSGAQVMKLSLLDYLP